MKVLTILGTRPEIIRLSRIIPVLDRHADHVVVHTGQNYDPTLSDIFFEQLTVRAPDRYLGVSGGGFANQAAEIIARVDGEIERASPDRIVILGDTNSGLAAIAAARRGIPVYHLEAGNRCYDDRVPEEVNRRIIDHCSAVLMPYTHRSKENLLREGIEAERIFVTGNPIGEVLAENESRIAASTALADLSLDPGGYFLVTLHRAENVDEPARLTEILAGLDAISREHGRPVIVSLHPRTADRISRGGITVDSDRIRLLRPFGFFDFVALERSAFCVITDSGTVQEECAILRVPNVTIRDVTERPETIEAGSNMLAGANSDDLRRAVGLVIALTRDWPLPLEYTLTKVSMTIAKIVLGFRWDPKRARR
ncbi:MAG: UDP-N-acetylglucosamine 2-epimerase (non-hydrolyzing) [Chloroflexota bacterium]|nr:MAG: UDP-N-acetylglucosamine 2-epimerase (non-hydrolyzing) [Chloroflexota bacterium]